MTCLRGLVIVTSLFCSVAVYAQNPAPAPQSAPTTHSKSADEQEVECHTDKGGRSFAWGNILGAFTAGGLSNAYYPPAERGFGLTMSRSAIAIGYSSLGGIVDEFYPDISHWLFHRHQKQSAD